MAVPPKLVNQIVSTLDSSKPVNQKVEEVIELLQASGFAHQGFRAHVAVMLFPSMAHGATWLQSDHVVQMHFLPAATLSTPVRSPSPCVPQCQQP